MLYLYFFFFFSIIYVSLCSSFFFFFNDTATTEIYTLSLHDALPIFRVWGTWCPDMGARFPKRGRSEEHTSELQSRVDLVCRLLLEKKKNVLIHKLLVKTHILIRKLTRTCRDV